MITRIREYLAKRKLERERPLYTKAFSDAYKDFEETRADDIEDRAKEIAERMLLDLIAPVDLSSVVSITKSGSVMLDGKPVEASQLANLQSEAGLLAQSEIWKLLVETPRKLAQDALFVKSQTLDDIVKAKAVLYILDTQQKILDSLR